MNNRDVVKLKHVAVCLAAFFSGGIVQLCSLSSGAFSLGPILPLQLSKPPSGSQAPGFVVSSLLACYECWSAAHQRWEWQMGNPHYKAGELGRDESLTEGFIRENL